MSGVGGKGGHGSLPSNSSQTNRVPPIPCPGIMIIRNILLNIQFSLVVFWDLTKLEGFNCLPLMFVISTSFKQRYSVF